MTTQPKTPTLAQLRKLANRKGRVIVVGHCEGRFPLSKGAELRGLFAALSALPDAKGGQR